MREHRLPLCDIACSAMSAQSANAGRKCLSMPLHVQWRGYVSNAHPSEVMPLSWPEVNGAPAALAPGTIQLGVSVEALGVVH